MNAFKGAMATPPGQKPSKDDWLAGPWRSEISALMDWALQDEEAAANVTVRFSSFCPWERGWIWMHSYAHAQHRRHGSSCKGGASLLNPE